MASIPEDTWTPVTCPQAIWDEDQQRLISDTEVAQVPCSALTSKKKDQAITARLIGPRSPTRGAWQRRGRGTEGGLQPGRRVGDGHGSGLSEEPLSRGLSLPRWSRSPATLHGFWLQRAGRR
jgi:hypothetical protein